MKIIGYTMQKLKVLEEEKNYLELKKSGLINNQLQIIVSTR